MVNYIFLSFHPSFINAQTQENTPYQLHYPVLLGTLKQSVFLINKIKFMTLEHSVSKS